MNVTNWYVPAKKRQDNYSMFSKVLPRQQVEDDVLTSLKQNQFIKSETFDDFLAKVNKKRGKKVIFTKFDAN